MSSEAKPRICEVLGVEVGERFKVESDTCVLYVDAYVSEDGTVRAKSITPMDTMRLCQIINGELRILRQPCFTADELATMRVLYAAGARYIAKDSETMQWITEKPEWNENVGMHRVPCGISHMLGYLPDDMFPSIRPGKSVELAAILEVTP